MLYLQIVPHTFYFQSCFGYCYTVRYHPEFYLRNICLVEKLVPQGNVKPQGKKKNNNLDFYLFFQNNFFVYFLVARMSSKWYWR